MRSQILLKLNCLLYVANSKRWNDKEPELNLADVEARLYPDDRSLTDCPSVLWTMDDCSFVVMKTGESNFRCQFFYTPAEQYGTGIEEYTDLDQCMTTLLQIHADHESSRQGNFPAEKKSE